MFKRRLVPFPPSSPPDPDARLSGRRRAEGIMAADLTVLGASLPVGVNYESHRTACAVPLKIAPLELMHVHQGLVG